MDNLNFFEKERKNKISPWGVITIIFIIIIFIVYVTVCYRKDIYELNTRNVINVNNDLKDQSPIILNEFKRPLPDRNGDIFLIIGTKVCFNCTTVFKTPFGENLKQIEAEFLGNKEFSFDDKTYKLSELECDSIPMPTTVDKGELIEIAYELGDGKSIPVMTIAFDRKNLKTLYVKHKIYPATVHRKKGVVAKNFVADPSYFGNINIKNSLKQSKVEKQFCDILKMNEEEIKAILNKKQFLTKGHLAAKADFIFSGDQKSSYNILNTCLQWQTVNSGNWSAIEEGLRVYANERNLTLTCYTGSMGVCTLPDKYGVEKELYIKCSNDGKLIVPKFIYRIVIAEETGEAIVFLCVNNPYLREDFDAVEYIIGKDVGDEIHYIKWDRRKIQKGYAYAISVADFMAAVNDFPIKDLQATDLLGIKSENLSNFSTPPKIEEEMEIMLNRFDVNLYWKTFKENSFSSFI